jgi:hypothetical protein
MMKSVLTRPLAVVAAVATPVFLAVCAPALAQGERGYETVTITSSGGGTGDPGATSTLPFTGMDLAIAAVLGLGLAMVGVALAVVAGMRRSERHKDAVQH